MNAQELSERLLELAIRIISLVRALPKSVEGRHAARQLLRAGTSPGANYEEACGAESRADFGHKIGIVLKELKESRYWLRIVRKMPLVKSPARVDPLLGEVEQLVAIFARSVTTVRKRLRQLPMSNDK